MCNFKPPKSQVNIPSPCFHTMASKGRVYQCRRLAVHLGHISRPTGRPMMPLTPYTIACSRGHPSGPLWRTYASVSSYAARASSKSARRAVWTIIGLNTMVFAAWTFAYIEKNSKIYTELQKNFMLSLQGWRQGRFWTAITSAFSHHTLVHFAFNMMTFHALSSILVFTPGVGAIHVVSLCAGSALLGSAGYLYHMKQKSDGAIDGRGPSYTQQRALGASGMVMGVASAATCLMPFLPVSLMFIPVGIPLWATTLLFAGVDTYFLNSNSPFGHAAHLGGAAGGVLYYLVFLRKYGGVLSMIRRGPKR